MDLFSVFNDDNLSLNSSEESSEESEILQEIVEEDGKITDIDFLPVNCIDNGDKTKLVYHCKSHEEALHCIKKYELRTTTRFVVYYANKNFGNTDTITTNHSVLWEDSAIPYSGIPYIVISNKVLDCHHGFDRNVSKKNDYKKNKKRHDMDDHCFQKNYLILQDSKKFMCPAKIAMKEIIHFPDFKISEKTEWRKKNASKLLRQKIKTSPLNEIQHTRTIVVSIDDLSCHDKHPVGQADLISQMIDPQISKKIEEYVKEGICNIREMKRLLRLFVKDIFEKENLPPPNNRRFYPCVNTIRSHIVKMKQKLRYSMIDQECLLKKCHEWKKIDPHIKVLIRPKCPCNGSKGHF
nr:uncharacterized protein LOC105849056 [Hydra vulgaris]